MHILSGIYKGRGLKVPLGIRPTETKTRKAVFDILGDITGITVLELFAGSGAVGLEALSRGAREVSFVEENRRVARILQSNIAAFAAETCRVYIVDVSQAVKRFAEKKALFDLIFLDPPYFSGGSGKSSPCFQKAAQKGDDLVKKTLQMVSAYDIVAPNGFVVAQHFKKIILPQHIGKLDIIKQNGYGDSVLSVLQKVDPAQYSKGEQ